MSINARGKTEIAYYKVCREIDRVFDEALECGVDPDDLIYYAYHAVTHKTDSRLQARATTESAIELRLKRQRNTAGQPVQDTLQADRTLSQDSTGENQGAGGVA